MSNLTIGPTYEVGLLQARAYRSLQANFNQALEPYGFTMTEWAMLGKIYDAGEIRLSDLGAFLSIKPPQVTVMIEKLCVKGLVRSQVDDTDSRARMTSLTEAGQRMVPRAEQAARNFMADYLYGLDRNKLLVYLEVLNFLGNK